MNKPKDDLISRAAVLSGISDLMKSPWYNDGKGGERHVQYLARKEAVDVVNVLCVVKEAAVDAVPVIRCRDCKYGEPETNGFGEDMVMCQNKQNPIGYEDWLMPPEFYCADGERRG